MKKYTATVTEDDVIFGIEEATAELEEDGQVSFPSDDARAEFIEDCITNTLDKFSLYEHYAPDYSSEVLDTAGVYGYQL